MLEGRALTTLLIDHAEVHSACRRPGLLLVREAANDAKGEVRMGRIRRTS
jgi:hypothetical protein